MNLLQILVTEIRGRLIRQLEKTEDREMLTAAPGLCNHITWHAGHALWVQDRLCTEKLTGKSELPTGWAETYGMNCRSPRETTEWASRTQLIELLGRQQARLLELLGQADEATLNREDGQDSHGHPYTLARTIIHGLHDEASHQGEIQVLRKIQRV